MFSSLGLPGGSGTIPAMAPLEELHDLLAERAVSPAVADAAQDLSARYRAGVDDRRPGLQDELDRDAYLAVRMPATSTACDHVFAELARRCDVSGWSSLVDLGAGPGSALWAAASHLSDLHSCTAYERDPGLIDRGRALVAVASHPALTATRWVPADLQSLGDLPPADVCTCAYALNELDGATRDRVVDSAWAAARQALVLVEAGTPRGFALLAHQRQRLLGQGAHIAAPCTHAGTCPFLADEQTGWCHVPVRVQRRRNHRALKGGLRGWEDEPCSYLIVVRDAVPAGGVRIVDRVHAHKGGAQTLVCAEEGLQEWRVGRREAGFRALKKATWGDRLER